MKDVDGLDVLDGVRAVDASLPVIIMTAFGAIESAVEAMRRGAFHYLTKPFKMREAMLFVDRALEDRRLREEIRFLRRMVGDCSPTDALLGRSRAIDELRTVIARLAPSSAPCLVLGESGAGKELVARALHEASDRRDAPFVAVNCSALPEALLESELFGHVRGAFTGAASDRRGLLVEADHGTLLLDEIGDMPAGLQTKLLRVLQDGDVRPVGADVARTVDVRIVAATHRDLETLIDGGGFRADLYYRLNVATIRVPPLRQRRDDVPVLVEHFLALARARNPHSRVAGFTDAALAALRNAPWPGNVRELQNAVERIAIISGSPMVDLDELLSFVPSMHHDPPTIRAAKERLVTLRELEDEYVSYVMAKVGGKRQRAAEVLGIDVKTLYRRERGR
jgi:two-component system response regulator HydG